MLIVLSPAKTLDYATAPAIDAFTLPQFSSQSALLVKTLKQFSVEQIGALMYISHPLAELNAGRFAEWRKVATAPKAKQAVLAFDGDVYRGLQANTLKPAQLHYLQQHVRILSGLYGALRPLDLMQPYRLEMGTPLPNARGKDLYAFWGERVTKELCAAVRREGATALVNLASNEYFKVVQPKRLPVPVITPVFQDWKGDGYKVISFHAKRARGLMTRFAARHDIVEPTGLRDFDDEGYRFSAATSTASTWVFRRRLPS